MTNKHQCSTCKLFKSKAEFHIKRNSSSGVQSKCKSCMKEFRDAHYAANREYYIEKAKLRSAEQRKILGDLILQFKENGCEVCGEDEPVCLDAHHKDPEEKDFNIGHATRLGFSADRLVLELSKCACLCSNCHRKVHAKLIKLQSSSG